MGNIRILCRSIVVIVVWNGFSALATVYKSDGSAASVQGLHNAALNGDTITIPPGNFTWTTPVTISKAITLTGANPANRPVVKSTYTGGFGITINRVPGRTTVVKDIKFTNWTSANALIGINGSGVNAFRLTNLDFDGGHRWSIWVSSPGGSGGEGPYGLIDHCRWPNGGDVIYARDNPRYSPNSWHRAMSWGTNKAIYIEDCTLSASSSPVSNAAFDGDNGCRIVFRHNTVNNWLTSIHGADSAGPINSGLQLEVMHNSFKVTAPLASLLTLRGGSAVFFDNTVTAGPNGGYNSVVELAYYRSLPGCGGLCQQDRFYPQDYLGTQQPGMGVVPGARSQDPHFPNEPWVSVPVYYWGNHVNAPIWYSKVATNQGSAFIQLGRDYFMSARPGYTEFTYPHPLQGGNPTPTP
jgi:hypothetical protein